MTGRILDLGHEGDPLALLRVALHDASIAKAQEAARGLVGLGPPSAEIVADLIAALKAERTTARRRAVNLLGMFGDPTPEAVIALSEALRDPGWTVREAAARALGLSAIGVEARAALVRAALRDRNRLVRDSSARALARGGDASDQIQSGLSDPRAAIRCRAFRALALVAGKGEKEIAPTLAGGLRDSHRKVRRAAAAALGMLRGGAEPALPELIRRMHDGEPTVRVAVAEALAQVEPALSDRWRNWLATLADPRFGPIDNLMQTLDRTDLPDSTAEEFRELCTRRALWHSRRGRLAPETVDLSQRSARQAAEVVLARAVRASKDEASTRAEVEEAAWLLARLAEILASGRDSLPTPREGLAP